MNLSNVGKSVLWATLAAAVWATAVCAEEVGKIGVDWLGNDIVIEAVEDPKVSGVTCHVSYFERGIIDRLQKGNWFEDPSNSFIASGRRDRLPSVTLNSTRTAKRYSTTDAR